MVDGDTHMKPFGPPESTEIKARDNRRNGEKTNASSGFSCANNVNMVTRPQQRWIFVLFDWGLRHQFVPFLGMRCHRHKWSLSIIQFSGDYRAFKIDDVPEWLSDDKRGSSGPGHRFWLIDSAAQTTNGNDHLIGFSLLLDSKSEQQNVSRRIYNSICVPALPSIDFFSVFLRPNSPYQESDEENEFMALRDQSVEHDFPICLLLAKSRNGK